LFWAQCSGENFPQLATHPGGALRPPKKCGEPLEIEGRAQRWGDIPPRGIINKTQVFGTGHHLRGPRKTGCTTGVFQYPKIIIGPQSATGITQGGTQGHLAPLRNPSTTRAAFPHYEGAQVLLE